MDKPQVDSDSGGPIGSQGALLASASTFVDSRSEGTPRRADKSSSGAVKVVTSSKKVKLLAEILDLERSAIFGKHVDEAVKAATSSKRVKLLAETVDRERSAIFGKHVVEQMRVQDTASKLASQSAMRVQDTASKLASQSAMRVQDTASKLASQSAVDMLKGSIDASKFMSRAEDAKRARDFAGKPNVLDSDKKTSSFGAVVMKVVKSAKSTSTSTDSDSHEPVQGSMQNDTRALEIRNKSITERANPLFEQINSNWEKVENYLRSKGIFRPASYTFGYLDNWQEQVRDGERQIGIQRAKGKWRICYGTMYYKSPGAETSWTPVTECDMETRTELLEYVPKLFEAVVNENEKFIPVLEAAVQKSNDVLRSLGIE